MKLKLFTPLLAAFFVFAVYALLGGPELLFMALVLALLPLLGLAFSFVSLTGIRVSREFPARLYEGQPAQVTLRVQNASLFPKFFLEMADSFSPSLGPKAPLFAPGLRPRQHILASYPIRPEKRGLYPLGPLTLFASDPIGVITLRRRVPLPDQILVYPTFPKLRKSPPSGPEKLGASLASVPSAGGAALDFHNIRDYLSGDEFRRIHWKTTARTGSLKTVEREHPSHTHAIAILYFPPGSNPGAGNHSPLEYAIKLAAGLAWAAIETGGTFTLVIPRPKGLPSLLTINNRSQFIHLLELLAKVEEPSSPLAPPPVLTLRTLIRRPQTLLLFAGKLDPPLSAAIASYRASGVPIRLVTFDASSFGPSPHLPGPTPPSLSPSILPSRHLSLIVRKGHDLAQILEEIAVAA